MTHAVVTKGPWGLLGAALCPGKTFAYASGPMTWSLRGATRGAFGSPPCLATTLACAS